MLHALIALDNGQPLSTTATEFGIPRNTLRRHLQNKNKKSKGTNHLGRESLLGPDIEKQLVEYILMLEEKGFGLTPKDVREIAFDYAQEHRLTNKFEVNTKMAGADWWAGFRLRHRRLLSIRKPEGLSLTRASAMNKPAIQKYFVILEKELQRLGLSGKPNCICNCDESGLSLVPDNCKVVGGRGKRNVYQITTGERGVLTTILPCYNAAGFYVPPMVICKWKRLSDGLKANMPAGALISVSDTGYMNKELFQLWLTHFKKNL